VDLRRRYDIKPLNLALLTDGEPNEKFEEIRDIIVDATRELKENHAGKKQIGLQLCQIGNDAEAVTFFKKLDNLIKAKYSLDRDVSRPTQKVCAKLNVI
jgi:hypothetical protein